MLRPITTLLAILFAMRFALAIPIASSTGGTFSEVFIPGQSFTVVAPGPVNNIVFNFFEDGGSTIPVAYGTGYLLSSEYLGLPSALSNATPGFLGMAVATAGFYTFDPALTLLPGLQYFLYSDTAGLVSGTTADIYGGGELYFSFASDEAFQIPNTETNFLVEGAPVATGVPELDGRRYHLALAAILCLLAISGRRSLSRPVQAA